MNITTFESVDYLLLSHIYINKSFCSHFVTGAVLKKGKNGHKVSVTRCWTGVLILVDITESSTIFAKGLG